jgi:glycine cleavage system H protein
VFSPVAGEVVEANAELATQPALVNEDAEGKAWFFKIKIANAADLDALMDRAAYEAFVKESS